MALGQATDLLHGASLAADQRITAGDMGDLPRPWSCARATLAITKAPTATARFVRFMAGFPSGGDAVASPQLILRLEDGDAFPCRATSPLFREDTTSVLSCR